MSQQKTDKFQQRCQHFFQEADADRTGFLTKLELCKVCVNAGCQKSVEEIAKWFDELDCNDDGTISRDEFMNALLKKVSGEEISEANLRAEFKKYDTDGSGCISLEELKVAVAEAGEDPGLADLDMDTNDDGKIGLEEFISAWKAGCL